MGDTHVMQITRPLRKVAILNCLYLMLGQLAIYQKNRNVHSIQNYNLFEANNHVWFVNPSQMKTSRRRLAET